MIFDRIKKICKEKGISVTSVEKKAGLSHAAIRKWNKSSPTVESLQAVAKVLDVTLDKLVEEEMRKEDGHGSS